MSLFLLSTFTLWQREMARFYRQPSRVVGAAGSPFLFWLVIGSGVGRSFQPEAGGPGYLEYFFSGTLLLVLLFTSIFSTISLIEDRREGFLQSVLVSPAPRSAVALGKILGGATLAACQGLLFLLLAPAAGFQLDAGILIGTITALWVNAFALTALGIVIAWRFDSVQGFHAVMNLFLMPLWLLSGSLFPFEKAAGWIQFLMKINPLTYGLTWIRASLEGGVNASAASVVVIFSVIMLIYSVVTVSAVRRE